jgi:hypothetical protein
MIRIESQRMRCGRWGTGFTDEPACRRGRTSSPTARGRGKFAAEIADQEYGGNQREVLLALKTKTVLGDFAVDERGFQVGQKAVTIQWQDGKQAVVWPEESATGKLRFPTAPWHQR